MIHIVDISEALLVLGLSASVTDEERAITLMCIKSAEGAVRRHLKYDPTYAERTEYYPQFDGSRAARSTVWEVTDSVAFERSISSASSNLLQLSHLPVRSITSLRIDYDGRAGTRSGAFAADTEKVLGTDYWPNFDGVDSDGAKVCRDGVIRSEGLWPAVAGSVKVVYYAGYKTAELRGESTQLDATPIWEACLEEVVRRVNKVYSRSKKTLAGFAGPLTSERLGDYSYSADSALLGRLIGGTDLMPETRDKLSDFEHYGFAL